MDMTADEYLLLAKLLYGAGLILLALFVFFSVRFRLLHLIRDVNGKLAATTKKSKKEKVKYRQKSRQKNLSQNHPTEQLQQFGQIEQDIVLVQVAEFPEGLLNQGKAGFMD